MILERFNNRFEKTAFGKTKTHTFRLDFESELNSIAMLENETLQRIFRDFKICLN